MKEVKKMLRDLSRGVNVKKNLPRYADAFVDTCYHEAVLKLTFSAYLLYEQKADDEEGMWDSPDAAKWFGGDRVAAAESAGTGRQAVQCGSLWRTGRAGRKGAWTDQGRDGSIYVLCGLPELF